MAFPKANKSIRMDISLHCIAPLVGTGCNRWAQLNSIYFTRLTSFYAPTPPKELVALVRFYGFNAQPGDLAAVR